MKIDFTGKTVLVTGASGGIGRAISLAFSRTNATIHAHYKSNKKEAEKTLQLLSGDNHSLHQADLSDHKEVEAMINNIGNINIVVNKLRQTLRKTLRKKKTFIHQSQKKKLYF